MPQLKDVVEEFMNSGYKAFYADSHSHSDYRSNMLIEGIGSPPSFLKFMHIESLIEKTFETLRDVSDHLGLSQYYHVLSFGLGLLGVESVHYDGRDITIFSLPNGAFTYTETWTWIVPIDVPDGSSHERQLEATLIRELLNYEMEEGDAFMEDHFNLDLLRQQMEIRDKESNDGILPSSIH